MEEEGEEEKEAKEEEKAANKQNILVWSVFREVKYHELIIN